MAREGASRADATARRLFVAVDVPGPAQDALDALVDAWRPALPTARWSPRTNRHVTIGFLGSTPPGLIDDVTEAVEAAAAAAVPFDLALAGCGRFPSRGKARVLWVGLEDPAAVLPALAAVLRDHLPDASGAEARPFRAHLTVARADPPLAAGGWDDAAPEPAGWRVTELLLVESHLGRPHARYDVVGRFPMGHVAATHPDPR